MINDEEDLLKSLRDYVKNNLNAQITSINTEKGDFTLEAITADDNHYVISGELLELPNHAFVNFAIGDGIATITNKDDIASIPIFMVEVAFDNPKKANTYFKSLRYMRALYETIVKFESSAIEVGEVDITKAIPMLVTNNKRELVVSGVELSVPIG